MKNKKRTFTIIGLSLALLPFIIILAMHITNSVMHYLTPSQIQTLTHGNPFLEAGVVLIIYAIKSVLFFIPIAFIYVLTGALFPPLQAILLNILGLCACLTSTFFLGRLLGRNRVEKLTKKSARVKDFLENPQKSDITLFLLRISGLFPVELISLVCGCSTYTYFKFLIFSLLAMIPTLIPFSIMGTAIFNPFSLQFIIPFVISVLIAICSLIYYKTKE